MKYRVAYSLVCVCVCVCVCKGSPGPFVLSWLTRARKGHPSTFSLAGG
jgi:hypothetical protein